MKYVSLYCSKLKHSRGKILYSINEDNCLTVKILDSSAVFNIEFNI